MPRNRLGSHALLEAGIVHNRTLVNLSHKLFRCWHFCGTRPSYRFLALATRVLRLFGSIQLALSRDHTQKAEQWTMSNEHRIWRVRQLLVEHAAPLWREIQTHSRAQGHPVKKLKWRTAAWLPLCRPVDGSPL